MQTRFLAIFCGLLAGLSLPVVAATDCTSTPGLERFYNDGWSMDTSNQRLQAKTGINAANISELELAWAFGMEDTSSPHSYPLVTEDSVFIGDESGQFYALDKNSGCVRWQFQADSNIRSAITHGVVVHDGDTRTLLFFGTFEGTAYAVDAATGAEIWQREMDPHKYAMVTGTPVFHKSRLYVPVSSYELMVAINPFYECCTFRGAVAALDAATGAELWRFYTIEEPATVQGSHWFFIDEFGPSGAPVWQAPAIDEQRQRLYFASGENYTDPTTDTSDTVFALNLDDGSLVWKQQFTKGDAFNAACALGDTLGPNCPESDGPDLDFGAPPILTRTRAGTDILLAGQKSSVVHAMDPEDGKVLWQQRVGRGGILGGVHWGMAANESLGLVFVPISGRELKGRADFTPAPGLHALDIATGKPVWSALTDDHCGERDGCNSGVSAAVIATPELVVAGSLDGRLYALQAGDGKVLWQFDSWRDYEAVNTIETEGGPIDVHGAMIADDMLFISSGYSTFGQKGGNAFLAFRLKPTD